MQDIAAYFVASIIIIVMYIGTAVLLKGTYIAYKEHNKEKELKKTKRRKQK